MKGIKAYNLKKEFNDIVAVDKLSFEIDAGQIVGLLGPNGAGKSTLIRLLAGIMAPTSGTAIINNHDLIKEKNEIKRLTGILPEEYALYEKLSVFEYIEFIATLYDMDNNDIVKKFNQLTKLLEISDLKNRLIETLSKGQKQKVALIASIIHDPEILFLDEPLANLDVKAQRVVKNMIDRYRSNSRLIIIATHLLSNVQAICDRVMIIDQGSLLYNDKLSKFNSGHEKIEDAYLELMR